MITVATTNIAEDTNCMGTIFRHRWVGRPLKGLNTILVETCRNSLSKRLTIFGIVIALWAVLLRDVSAQTSSASVCNFDNFIGVDHLPPAINPSIPLKWARGGAVDIHWNSMEPRKGSFNKSMMDEIKEAVLEYQTNGITAFPVILGAPPSWTGTTNSNFSSVYSQDWSNYVSWVVSNLSAAPYNLRIFQIWNEPDPNGWWNDNIDSYIQTCLIPGANAVHQFSGCQVVYGGHGSSQGIKSLVGGLTRNNVWGLCEYIDNHYYPLKDLVFLYDQAQLHGVTPGIWEAECGYTSDATVIPNDYMRFYYWALDRWVKPDQFKLMWYAWNEGDNLSLMNRDSDSSLSLHGKCLHTLCSLLHGVKVKRFTEFTNNRHLKFNLTQDYGSQIYSCSIEGFRVDNNVIIAIHGARGTDIKITFPSSLVNAETAAKRVDVVGTESSLRFVNDGNGKMTVTVPVADTNPDAIVANSSGIIKTFYVSVSLSSTQTPNP